MKTEVNKLTTRLYALGQQQQATAAQVAQMQTRVQKAAANAESAQSKIETTLEQVNVAVVQTPDTGAIDKWADRIKYSMPTQQPSTDDNALS